MHFDHVVSKASPRLYILRVCKHYGYYLQELTLLFDSLIIPFFSYAFQCNLGLVPMIANTFLR